MSWTIFNYMFEIDILGNSPQIWLSRGAICEGSGVQMTPTRTTLLAAKPLTGRCNDIIYFRETADAQGWAKPSASYYTLRRRIWTPGTCEGTLVSLRVNMAGHPLTTNSRHGYAAPSKATGTGTIHATVRVTPRVIRGSSRNCRLELCYFLQ